MEETAVASTSSNKDLTGIEGIQVYDQEQFEENVSKKLDVYVEKQKREHDLKRLTKEYEICKISLAKSSLNLSKAEESLSEAVKRGQSDRKLQIYLDQQEKFSSEVEKFKKSKLEIKSQLKEVNVGFHDEEVEVLEDGELLEKEEEEKVETEQEKSIRLGNMTAFGKVLVSKTERDVEGNNFALRDFVKDWMDSDEDDNDEVSSRPKTKPLAIPPKTANILEALLSKGRDKVIKTKEKVVRHVKEDKEGWNTDDSDWESTDKEDDSEDGDSDGKVNARIARKKPKSFQTIDDGDKNLYLQRLQDWQDSRKSSALDSKYEELEGGLRVPERLWQGLYHYQRVAVQWLWELHQQDVGGILGDEMGLGKTVQLAAFLASLSYSGKRQKQCALGPTLIVCPTTVMHQWVKELHTWWPPFRVCILHDSGSFQGPRQNLIRSIGKSSSSGILVTSYSAVVNFKDTLMQQSFDYVILDEGHKIRNPDAQVTLAVKQFATAHRLILSGSPLQNNLKELWSLFDFIYPGKLGTLPVFMQQFSFPITLGGYSNASRSQVATAHKCATVLRDTINPYLLRRLKSDVKDHINLPTKNEQVLFCRLTEEQRTMYRTYIESGEVKNILDGRTKVFLGLINLRKMCNHPDLFDGGPKLFGKEAESTEAEERFGFWKRSGKMIVIEALLKLWKRQNHKVLLFTQSRKMLTILEYFLMDNNYTYLKMDGVTAIGSRQGLINKFNNSKDLFVFLLTTRVGGLGVNLTGANRVVIFDPDWNPSTDTQARERAWRIGQTRDVTIYRLLTSGTIEEKIYHRQIFKQLLVNRVLKDPTQKRFFKSNDLHDLFTFSEGTSDKTETSAIFAGTNSEVEVHQKSRKRKKETEDVRACAVMPVTKKVKKIDTFKVIKEDYKLSQKTKIDEGKEVVTTAAEKREVKSVDLKNVSNDIDSPTSVKSDCLSDKERERLREKVRQISMKIANKETTTQPSSSKKKKHKKEKRRLKDAKFEGKRVPYLDKTDVYQPAVNPDEDKAKDDDYVLSRLFKKSGVHSALQHDVIMNGDGGADYALIDAEAERVAKEAVARLRDSRRQCFRATSGIPTWTGSNGLQAKPRFGKSSKKSSKIAATGSITASELLQRMRSRNRLMPNQERSNFYEGQDLFQPDHQEGFEPNVELLTDIRNFIAFQNRSAGDGETTTQALIEHFKDKLPPVKNPLFKAILNEICTFQKNQSSSSNNVGIWRLNQEFR